MNNGAVGYGETSLGMSRKREVSYTVKKEFVMILGKKQFAFILFVCILAVLPGCTRHAGDADKTADLAPVATSKDGEIQTDADHARWEEMQSYTYRNDKFFYSMSDDSGIAYLENPNILYLRDFEGKIVERFPLKELLDVKGLATSWVSCVSDEEIFVQTHFWENDPCIWRIPLDEDGMPDGRQAEKFYEFPDDAGLLSSMYADEGYILFFDEDCNYREYDRHADKYLTVDGTDAKYRQVNASGVEYNITDYLEEGNILLEKDQTFYVHQLGSEKNRPLSLDGELPGDMSLDVCSTAGRIYYAAMGLYEAKEGYDIWYYDTKNGTNEKILPWEEIRAAVIGKQPDGQADVQFSGLYGENGQIYLALDVAADADAESLTQIWRYSPESGEFTAEKGVSEYLRYLEKDIYTDEEMFEQEIYVPYIKAIVCGKCIIDFDYKEYFYDLESGEKGEIKEEMPEYYYSRWLILPD